MGGGGVGSGKGTGKSMRKLCRNYPLAIYPVVSPPILGTGGGAKRFLCRGPKLPRSLGCGELSAEKSRDFFGLRVRIATTGRKSLRHPAHPSASSKTTRICTAPFEWGQSAVVPSAGVQIWSCVCSYMAGHYPGILMTGHIGTNTPKFVPPRWGRPRFDPAVVCKLITDRHFFLCGQSISNCRCRIPLAEKLISITQTDLWEFQQEISRYRYRFSLEFQFVSVTDTDFGLETN